MIGANTNYNVNGNYTFKGNSLSSAVNLVDEKIEPYKPDPQLVEAVNLAIYLKRPLLVKGAPGSGKTKLANAIAWEFYGRNGAIKALDEKYKGAYFEWHIKSTTNAKDGLYRYRHIDQLREIQYKRTNIFKKRADDLSFVDYGPLGLAFQVSLKEKIRPVILIDEIDKASIDFPNDLLLELDELRYTITELKNEDGRERKADSKNPPIVIITSNDEKELPEAFLRRCIYYYIDFPNKDMLYEIVTSHFEDRTKLPGPYIENAIQTFVNLRESVSSSAQKMKIPSTSELIDWFKILSKVGEHETLPDILGKVPYSWVLLKGLENPHKFLESINLS